MSRQLSISVPLRVNYIFNMSLISRWFIRRAVCYLVCQARKITTFTLRHIQYMCSTEFLIMSLLPVTSFATGIAAGGSGASSVALGVAWIFPRKSSHMFIWVGSPHSAVVRRWAKAAKIKEREVGEEHEVIKLPDAAFPKKYPPVKFSSKK